MDKRDREIERGNTERERMNLVGSLSSDQVDFQAEQSRANSALGTAHIEPDRDRLATRRNDGARTAGSSSCCDSPLACGSAFDVSLDSLLAKSSPEDRKRHPPL